MRMPQIRVQKGDALAALKRLPSGRCHCIMTTPSTFGSVAYDGTAGIVIGAEETFEEHLENLITIFAEARRVLRSDGVFFLHYGDYHDSDKELQLYPARVAMALQEDAWLLRGEIPANSHEKVFVFTRSNKFYWNERAAAVSDKNRRIWLQVDHKIERPHFAHCPEDLMETLFKMGVGIRGCCENCGAARYILDEVWVSGCACGLEDVPCRVLDPFYGSGTTAIVAAKLDLDCYGIEMNPKWIEIAEQNLERKVGMMLVDYKKK